MEFLTVNYRKHLLKITRLGVDGFEHSIAVILSCPFALVKVCVTPSRATAGKTYQNMVKKLFIFADFLVSRCFQIEHIFLFQLYASVGFMYLTQIKIFGNSSGPNKNFQRSQIKFPIFPENWQSISM